MEGIPDLWSAEFRGGGAPPKTAGQNMSKGHKHITNSKDVKVSISNFQVHPDWNFLKYYYEKNWVRSR